MGSCLPLHGGDVGDGELVEDVGGSVGPPGGVVDSPGKRMTIIERKGATERRVLVCKLVALWHCWEECLKLIDLEKQ